MAKQLTAEKSEPNQGPDMNEKSREQEIREDIERIYRTYGPDLSALQRDVQKELRRQRDRDNPEAAA